MRKQGYTNRSDGIVYEKIELPTLGDVAVINRDQLQSLLDEECTSPTGEPYPTKFTVKMFKFPLMWKCLDFETGGWLICEFVDHPTNPDLLRAHVRRAALPETIGLVAEGILWWLPD